MKEENTVNTHSVVLSARKKTEIKGVLEVYSYDNDRVELSTTCGDLVISGDGLCVESLNIAQKEMTVVGLVVSLTYVDIDHNEKKSFFSRLFG